MSDPSGTPPSAPAAAPVGKPDARRPRRIPRLVGRSLLALFLVLLAALAGVLLARDSLLTHQVLPRIGPLIGGTLAVDSIHLSLAPLALEASGIRLEIPQVKAPITATHLAVAPLAGRATIDGIEILRPGGSDKGPVIAAKRVEAEVELSRVIHAPYPVNELRIEEPVIRVRLLEPGWTNAQAVLGMTKPNAAKYPPLPPATFPDGHGSTSAGTQGGGPSVAPAPPSGGPALFYLRHAEVGGGTLIYDDPLSDASNPVHVEVRELAIDVRDFQYQGDPVGDPLTDVRVDGRIAQPSQAGWLHVRAWAEPWRAKPTLWMMAAITGFDVRTIDPYTAGVGGAALGGNWIHAILDVHATNAQIQQGVVSVTVAESGTEMKAPFTGDLFRPTIDKNSALVSAFQLPLGHLLKLGNVSLDVAGQLAIAGLESVLKLGQGAADAGAAVTSGATGSNEAQGESAQGGGDFFSSLGMGIAAFGSGVANAAKRLFQGGQEGANTVGTYGQPTRPIAEILAEFEPRHRETVRAFLRERIATARKIDPDRLPELEAELTALGPSPVVVAPAAAPATAPATGAGAGGAAGAAPQPSAPTDADEPVSHE
ncbi:MAG: hypothetical protein U0610_14695 [bacterium]